MRRLKKGKSPYSIRFRGSDGIGVDYIARNKRTGWTKSYTKYSASGKPSFF